MYSDRGSQASQQETSRLEVTPELTYRLSDQVTADFMLEYEKFNGDTRQPSYTCVNGGFNVRVNITQNYRVGQGYVRVHRVK